MNCNECYWCHQAHESDEMICQNKKSENYNQQFPKQEQDIRGCDKVETKRAVDYRNLTPWQFASKYYI